MLYCPKCEKLSNSVLSTYDCPHCGGQDGAYTDFYSLEVVKTLMQKGYEIDLATAVRFERKKAYMFLCVCNTTPTTPIPLGFDKCAASPIAMSIEHTYSQSQDRQKLHDEIVKMYAELLKWAQSLPTVERRPADTEDEDI